MTDFDDGKTPTTAIDEAEALDEAAEDLAVFGPPDHARESTPTTLDPCAECGGKLTRIAGWIHQPASADDVWRHWAKFCVSDQGNNWAWCPKTGWFTGYLSGRMRVYWERRKIQRKDPP
jgi:hypothetical protein